MPAEHPPPPGRLSHFPSRTQDGAAGPLFRLFVHRDPRTGAVRSPWWFAARPAPAAGRFDLVRPHGTCYLADHRYGAWLEVFRGTGLVDRLEVERRRLLVAVRTGAGLALADLAAAAARPYGVTAELAAGTDYLLPHLWADALHAAGFAGVVAAGRHDPTHTTHTVALFGRAGSRQRLGGWRSELLPVADDAKLLAELVPFGTGVAALPYEVPITPVRT
ncbi:MAG: RES domain-containing protein [Mycobacteriales bacterium]